MSSDNGPGAPQPFIRPRIVLAFILTVVLSILLVLDAAEDDYALSELTLTVLLGGILYLVGVEFNDLMRGGKK